MPDEAAEKTQQPTPRKLQRAKERGQVPRSQELGSVAILMTLLLALGIMAPHLLAWFTALLKESLTCQRDPMADPRAFVHFFNHTMVQAVIATSPITGSLIVASILGTLAVGGYAFSAENVKLRWDAINPANNLKKLFDTRSIVRLALSIAKLALVSLITWFYLRDKLEVIAGLRWAWSGTMLAVMSKTIFGLCLRIGGALLAIALADVLYQKWKFLQDMRMSVQEIKQEHKDVEGSPEVKARMRRIRAQRIIQQIQITVPNADVVLVNPTHYAVALRYDAKTMDSPMVVAKGADHLAAKIREIARAYGVPVVRRPELTRTLFSTVEPGHTIPEGLFMAVAEVLAMIYRLRKKKKKR